jgi:ATP-dependent DNA helicase RecQ
VRKALSAVLRTGESFGAGHLIDILTGTSTPKVVERRHDQLPTFAVGRDLSKLAWAAVFRQMMGRDLVRPDAERFGALRMTDAALPILKGLQAITLRADTVEKADKGDRYTARGQVDEDDVALLTALKAKRRRLAEAQGVPAYVVFPDKTLIEMAEKRPQTLDQMTGINGIGARKLESYGQAFLEVILGTVPESIHPARRKLAGSDLAPVFDRLVEAQLALARGDDGTGKYLSCTHSTLRLIAERRPATLGELAAVQGMGAQKVERFGAAFMVILQAG